MAYEPVIAAFRPSSTETCVAKITGLLAFGESRVVPELLGQVQVSLVVRPLVGVEPRLLPPADVVVDVAAGVDDERVGPGRVLAGRAVSAADTRRGLSKMFRPEPELNQYGQLVRVIGIAEVGQPAAGLAKRIRGGISGEFELGKPADHPAATSGRHWQRAGGLTTSGRG
jgi:hypothetical protein